MLQPARITILSTLVIALVAALALGNPGDSGSPASAQDGDGAVRLTLLHSNDSESALLPLTHSVPASSGTIDLPVGGAAAFRTLTSQQEAEARAGGNAVLNVFAGDAILPGTALTCSQLEGHPFYDALAQDAMGYDVHIFGNHEFDLGPDVLEAFIRQFGDGSAPDQPFLSANLDFSGEPGYSDLIDADGLITLPVADGRVIGRSAIVVDPETGQRFGIVAATTPDLPESSSPRNVTVTPDLETTAAAVQDAIDRLYDEEGVHRIIFVSHLQGLQNDIALIGLLSHVDIAVAGGGHELLQSPSIDSALQLLPGETAPVAGDYPIEATDTDGRTVYLVTTAGQYAYLGRIDADFDADGEVTAIVASTSYPRPVVPASEQAAALGYDLVVPADPGVAQNVIAPLEECIGGLAQTPVATSEVLLDVSFETVRARESNAGNLITDAYLYAYDRHAGELGLPASGETPVIALQNGGGMRQTAGDVLPAGGTVPGEIYVSDTLNVLPFENPMVVLEGVTPADVKAAFEQSVSALPDLTGRFMQVGGVRVVYDLSQPAGSRVVSVTLKDGTPIVTGGAIVEGAPSVTVVTHNFTATGGDGYDVFARNPNRTRLPGTDTQAWREYLEHLGTIEAGDARYQPGGEGRITFQSAPTPTPTATATPTATPTAIPATPTRIVPRPPDTGTGTASDGNTGPVWLAVAGAMALAGGAAVLRRTRRG